MENYLLTDQLITLAAEMTRPLAYLDPGSGSYLLQLLIAALLGAAFALRMYWGRIKSFFRRGSDREDSDSEQES
jgi:hypothetical protein